MKVNNSITFTKVDHNAEKWTGHLQYPKILLGIWITLGLFSLTIETA
jgi:hypothetical protein